MSGGRSDEVIDKMSGGMKDETRDERNGGAKTGIKRFFGWWKKESAPSLEKRYIILIKSLLLALLPIVCCGVYCAGQGRSIGEVYLPDSPWNDELFYFKQVEGIISYGYPQGYFGFNESHALRLSFAAWSPVLVFPWIIWGVLFGWNLMSPIICNIFLMTLCCFLYVWLVKPTWKQLGILSFLFCLYTPFTRYMLSGMPEVICFCMLIFFYALAINYLQREKNYKLALLFLLSGIMTLMRPYLILFMLLPAGIWIRRDKWKGLAGTLVISGAVLGLYAGIKHYLSAEYFDPLFFTDWFFAFFEEGVFGGIRYTFDKLHRMGRDFYQHALQGLREGLASGAIFVGYLVCLFVLLIQSIRDWALKRKRLLTIEAHLAFSFVAMLFALLLMYKLTEGSKHLLTFIAAAVFVIPLMETRFYKKAVLVGAVFAYLYTYMAIEPYDYQVPFVQEERMAAVEEWRDQLAELLVLDETYAPNYENVVIWTFNDVVDETPISTRWQLLYALPEGFGISCCMREYVLENFDSLQSKYLYVVPGGAVESRCIQAGYQKIAESENAVLYQRY